VKSALQLHIKNSLCSGTRASFDHEFRGSVFRKLEVDLLRLSWTRPSAQVRGARRAIRPSNLPRGFQRFGFVNPFRAGGFSDLGKG